MDWNLQLFSSSPYLLSPGSPGKTCQCPMVILWPSKWKGSLNKTESKGSSCLLGVEPFVDNFDKSKPLELRSRALPRPTLGFLSI